MKKLLWQDDDPSVDIDAAVADYTAGDDTLLDRQIFAFDIVATKAHVAGLVRIELLNADEGELLRHALDELLAEFQSGRFVLDSRFEDGHSAIEFYLTEKCGELGAKVHTGRSRNDQVSTATRLYLKDRVQKLIALNVTISRVCLEKAEAHAMTPMPGYTHLQRAVPSSVGLWMASFGEAFADNARIADDALGVLDASPLGSAAGYGVNLSLDRKGVADELGFDRVQINPMYVQNSRGKFELIALQALNHAMQDLRRLAWDLSLFTTQEFDLVALPKKYTTGSSIMPNKSNPDVVELFRGSVAVVAAACVEIQSLISLPSGYQRDLQFTKEPLIRATTHGLKALNLVPELIRGLTFNEAQMSAAISKDMHATDVILEQSLAGVPFRHAYANLKSKMGDLEERDPIKSIQERVSPGACADLQIDAIRARLVRFEGNASPSK